MAVVFTPAIVYKLIILEILCLSTTIIQIVVNSEKISCHSEITAIFLVLTNLLGWAIGELVHCSKGDGIGYAGYTYKMCIDNLHNQIGFKT